VSVPIDGQHIDADLERDGEAGLVSAGGHMLSARAAHCNSSGLQVSGHPARNVETPPQTFDG
jgi:hypothetical protein